VAHCSRSFHSKVPRVSGKQAWVQVRWCYDVNIRRTQILCQDVRVRTHQQGIRTNKGSLMIMKSSSLADKVRAEASQSRTAPRSSSKGS
jgi:hypothetical protein